MLKTLKTLFKQDKEKFVVPKSVQAIIPIKTIWEDGIFLVGSNKYAKTFKFEDINYTVASREDKEAMFLEYCLLYTSKKKPYALYQAEKNGMPTRDNVARQAVDEAISKSFTLKDFDRQDVYKRQGTCSMTR